MKSDSQSQRRQSGDGLAQPFSHPALEYCLTLILRLDWLHLPGSVLDIRLKSAVSFLFKLKVIRQSELSVSPVQASES